MSGDVNAGLDPEDRDAIRALVLAHFDGMRWDPDTPPDWDLFRADFLDGAALYPAARPVAPKTVERFIARMEEVAADTLRSFEEHTQGLRILGFGSVAVVLASSWMLENGRDENQDVSGYLVVKDAGAWKIAAHAWDKATPARPVPEALT